MHEKVEHLLAQKTQRQNKLEDFLEDLVVRSDSFILHYIHNIKTVIGNLPILYWCKDYKNLKRDKKFLGSSFLFVFGTFSVPS